MTAASAINISSKDWIADPAASTEPVIVDCIFFEKRETSIPSSLATAAIIELRSIVSCCIEYSSKHICSFGLRGGGEDSESKLTRLGK